ncbi:hypothetical protein [Tunturiibacter lichenicola]|uniref:hypothetical protein n=1 Tax=Tunturiibacter lichenicola TaxID=2051959 RepID=UPI0021B35D53|nr:hypothetical protein [Edaphobacter lichenicola]
MTELRAIRKDRVVTERQALDDRKAQDKEFQGIRGAENAHFDSTAAALTQALSGIKSTLDSSNTTLIQTQAHAAIRVTGIGFAENPSDGKVHSGVSYPFNTTIINKGNDTALIHKELVEIYTGKPDDLDAQKSLVLEFEKEWKKLPSAPPSPFVAEVPVTNTSWKTLSQEDIPAIERKQLTIYFLYRFEYSDASGYWRTEECEAMQNGPTAPLNTAMFHYCSTFRNARVAVRP